MTVRCFIRHVYRIDVPLCRFFLIINSKLLSIAGSVNDDARLLSCISEPQPTLWDSAEVPVYISVLFFFFLSSYYNKS